MIEQSRHCLRRAHVKQRVRTVRASLHQLRHPGDEQPFDYTVSRRNPRFHRFLRTARTEIGQAMKLQSNLPGQLASGGGQHDSFPFAPGQFRAEKSFELADLPADQRSPGGISFHHAGNPSFFGHQSKGTEPVQRNPTFCEERFKHDFIVMHLAESTLSEKRELRHTSTVMKTRTHLRGLVAASPAEYLVIFRRGAPRLAGRGATAFCVPLLDKAVLVPSTAHQLEFSADQITAENQGIQVDGFAIWRIEDPVKACTAFPFHAEDPIEQIHQMLRSLVESAIRHQIAKMTIEDALRKRGSIILALKQETDYVTSGWGISLDTIEIRTVKILSKQLFENLQARFRETARLEAETAELETSRKISEKRMAEREAIAALEQEAHRVEIERKGERDRWIHDESIRTIAKEIEAQAERNRLTLLSAEGIAAVATVHEETNRNELETQNARNPKLALVDTMRAFAKNFS